MNSGDFTAARDSSAERKEEKKKKRKKRRREESEEATSTVVSRRCSRRVPAVAVCTVDVAVLPSVQSLRRVAIRFPGLISNILTAIVHFGDGIALSRALPIVFPTVDRR